MAARAKAKAAILITDVRDLPKKREIVNRFIQRKLTIGFVKWEDTARYKGSCWGPNISDVTLDVNDHSFPIIGTNNFQDPTLDMDIDRFMVHVGNEQSSGSRKQLSFRNYLQNISQYIDSPVTGSLYLDRDEKILTSTQCCILPLQDGQVPFNVRIHNYQADATNPAVLVVVVSPHGTSAQLLTERQQKIYFNKQGQKAPYLAERLKDVRRTAGRSTKGAMSQAEKEDNVLFIFQIPLKPKPPPPPPQAQMYLFGGDDDDSEEELGGSCDLFGGDCDDYDDSTPYRSLKMSSSRPEPPKTRGMDHAQLRIGDSLGPWTGTNSNISIERDDRYPIRCTIQRYRVTDSADIPDYVIAEIGSEIWKFYVAAPSSEKGSLVTETNPARVTEPELPATACKFFDFE